MKYFACLLWLVAVTAVAQSTPSIPNPLSEREAYMQRIHLLSQPAREARTAPPQNAVGLCLNGNFEEFVSVGSVNMLSHYVYATGEAPKPTQCQAGYMGSVDGIQQYDPSLTSVMARTVPSNYIDEFIGPIGAFDQYALMINYKDSPIMHSVVRTRRIKTNNETSIVFNYKAVLQSILDDEAHVDNQPFLKARVLSQTGAVVSEFCLVGDKDNCIFTTAPYLEGGSIVLYTKNWQVGTLDVSQIPDNQEFTIEFIATRCGLMGHFGYVFIDDVCAIHTDETLQGSVTLDPMYADCPTFPMQICGSYTIPNSNGISATMSGMILKLADATGSSVYTSTTPPTIDTANKRFCFSVPATAFPNTTSTYNASVSADFTITGTGCTSDFDDATDVDANPGPDISFLNCQNCNLVLDTAQLSECDPNHDGKAFFNLAEANTTIVSSQSGLSFSYFTTYDAAVANTGAIANAGNYESISKTVYVRVSQSAACFKIIPITLKVRNPVATISGILNVCNGGTTLTASDGISFLWSTGETTKSIVVSNIGTYSVSITDSFGCTSTGSVTISPNQVAMQPDLQIMQPDCFSITGTITVTSPASEYSFDNGATWGTTPTASGLAVGTYQVKVKTTVGCVSYAVPVTINPFFLAFPDYTKVEPTACGGTGSITITSPAVAYSFDDGLTWGTSNTLSGIPSGTYKIRFKNQFGCISNANSVVLTSDFLPDATYSVVNPTCGTGGSITITTPGTEFSFDGGTTWVTDPTLLNASDDETYMIKVKNSQGCTSPSVYVYLHDFSSSYPDVTEVQPQCGVGGTITINTTADFYSFDNGVTWGTDPIGLNMPPGNYVVKVKTASGCISQGNYTSLYEFHLPYPHYTTTAPYCGDGGSITVTDTATEYSFDGGVTWTPNAVATGLPEGYYEVIIRNGTGCTSYTSWVSLWETFEPSPVFTVLQPSCTAKGSITITSAGSQFSFDGGATWQTSNTLSGLDPGQYEIMTKTSGGCESYRNYVYLDEPHLSDPIITVTDPFCLETTGTIVFDVIPGCVYSFDGGQSFQASPSSGPLLPGYYILVAKDVATACESRHIYAYVNYPYGIPAAPTGPPQQLFCVHNSPTLAFIKVEGENIRWYEDAALLVPITSDVALQHEKTYYATQTVNGCESQTALRVDVLVVEYEIPVHPYETPVCDDGNDGREIIDLNEYNFGLIDGYEAYTFEFYTSYAAADAAFPTGQIPTPTHFDLPQSGPTTVYARVIAPNGCWKATSLTMYPVPSPFLVMKDHYFVCENESVTLYADPGYNTYLWSTGQDTDRIIVTQPGIYTVTVGRYHGIVTCTSTAAVKVDLSAPATITNIDTSDWTDHDNSISVQVAGPGDYEYALDGVHYQDSPLFSGLISGFYTVYVRDKNGCGTTEKETYLLMYPNFFTPNGDGYNDYWSIRFASAERDLDVKIFTREGKFLRQLRYDQKWDGTYDGRPVPADDYWFLVTRADGTEHRGHFALKR